MGTLVEIARHECSAMERSNQNFLQAAQGAIEMVIGQAEEIANDRKELGEEKTQILLRKCEENLKALLEMCAEDKSYQACLSSFPNRVGSETSPSDLMKLFEAQCNDAISAARRGDFTPSAEYHKLRKLMQHTSSDGGQEEHGEEDDVQMTQETIHHINCPYLQEEMTTQGELRPVKAKGCKTVKCVLSYKALLAQTQNGKKVITCSECKNTIHLKDVKDDRDTINKIKQMIKDRDRATASSSY